MYDHHADRRVGLCKLFDNEARRGKGRLASAVLLADLNAHEAGVKNSDYELGVHLGCRVHGRHARQNLIVSSVAKRDATSRIMASSSVSAERG